MKKPHYNCPVQATVNAISGKWKVQIIWQLSFGPLRFAELRDSLAGISEKVLTAQLRELETDQIVSRAVTPTVPPRVDYALTSAGRKLVAPMQRLCEWGTEQFGIVGNLKQARKVS